MARAASRAPVPPLSAPPPAPAAAAGDWPARLARIDALPSSSTFTMAMRRLLDPLEPLERQTLLEFEARMRQQPRFAAMVMGVRNGRLAYSLSRNAADAPAAIAQARRRCQERHRIECHAVLVGDRFLPEGFAAAARALGAQPPEVVRSAIVAAFASTLATQQAEDAQAAARPGSAPASAMVEAPGAAWAEIRSRLRGPAAPQDLAGALAVLLQVGSAADREQLARLQAFSKRQRWNSAIAMGTNAGGWIAWHGWDNERRPDWAREQASERCSRLARSPCVIVAANGDLQIEGIRDLAARLGTRPPAEVRQDFLRKLQRNLP
jgi:hypothetical protein